MIAVCIPSRGIMHSRTIDDVLKNTVDFKVKFIFSHGRGQPDAQNYITEEALKLNPDYVWFIDDDMQIPEGVLEEMLARISWPDVSVVTAHYPCSKNSNDALHIRDGKFENTGMGCVLVEREVFNKLEKPYFRTDVEYTWNGEELEEKPAREGVDRHGGHDVYFSQQLVKAGIIPAVIETKLGQYNIVNNPYRKYGNSTNLECEVWRLPG